jgi:hypothetical protein
MKRPHFIVIDLLSIENSKVCKTKDDVATTTGVHRNTIDPDKARIYSHFYVKPYTDA